MWLGSKVHAVPRSALFQQRDKAARLCAPQVEQLLSGEGSRAPTFAKIHGNNSDLIKAADLDLMRCPGSVILLSGWRCTRA